MEDYLKKLVQALHAKIGTFIGHITELEIGIQTREEELKRLYQQYEPHRLEPPKQANAGPAEPPVPPADKD